MATALTDGDSVIEPISRTADVGALCWASRAAIRAENAAWASAAL